MNIDKYLTESALWNLYVVKNGKKEKVNKKPMKKKELEDMMDKYEESGIKKDSLETEIIK